MQKYFIINHNHLRHLRAPLFPVLRTVAKKTYLYIIRHEYYISILSSNLDLLNH
jgi:hypothetical protein